MKCSICGYEGHNKRSCTKTSIDLIESKKEKPSNFNSYWIYYGNNSKFIMQNNSDFKGKWMLFYNKNIIDIKWEMFKKLYDSNKLIGVTSMKVSGAMDNPRASDKKTSVIILYCYGDKKEILSTGFNLLLYLDDYTGDAIYFKSDTQTDVGTRATGINNNHMFKLNIPQKYLIMDD